MRESVIEQTGALIQEGDYRPFLLNSILKKQNIMFNKKEKKGNDLRKDAFIEIHKFFLL